MLALPLAFSLSLALAAPHIEPVTWTYGGTDFRGEIVWDDATKTPRPGLLMVPNWMGINASAREKATKIAGTRYVILLVDMYGKDVRPTNAEQARAAASAVYADRAGMRGRANAALTALRAQAGKAPIDLEDIGAIGFCFGGATVLELARSGAALDGVVSFHGSLSTPLPAAPGAVKAPVLVLHGAADPNVKPEDVTALTAEMTAAGADWQLVQLGGAVHCFAEPDAASPPGCVYDAKAASRAFAMMEGFWGEVFAK